MNTKALRFIERCAKEMLERLHEGESVSAQQALLDCLLLGDGIIVRPLCLPHRTPGIEMWFPAGKFDNITSIPGPRSLQHMASVIYHYDTAAQEYKIVKNRFGETGGWFSYKDASTGNPPDTTSTR